MNHQPLNVDEYEALARERLPRMVYDFYASGADDESTLHDNRQAWGRLQLCPRVLVDVSQRELSTTVLGQPVAMPVLLAPCSFNALAHIDGECAVARAAAAASLIQVVSTLATYSLEEVAAASAGGKWFQLYAFRDRGITRMLVERAEAAGYRALCLTVDVPVQGQRERDRRNGFALPSGMVAKNLEPVGLHEMPAAADESALEEYVNQLWDPGLTWEAVDWLRSITHLPVLLKGILHPDDARLAVEHGAAAVIVSNHGGRQLDGAPPTGEVLAPIVEAVAGQVEVLVDGGIRRGTDVLKALALGARAVLIGRPYLWGLAVNGETGVRHVLELLRAELRLSLALTGRPTFDAISRSLIVPGKGQAAARHNNRPSPTAQGQITS